MIVCGICGFYSEKPISYSVSKMFEKVMVETESRGKDSFGFYVYPSKKTFKRVGSVSENIAPDEKKNKRKKNHFYNRIYNNTIALGHCRNATQG